MSTSRGFSTRVPLAILCATPAAWLIATLMVGRSIPWHANRWWFLTFAASFLLLAFWWHRLFKQPIHPCAFLLVLLPSALVPAVLVGAIYSSDEFNDAMSRSHWWITFLAGLLLVAVLADSLGSEPWRRVDHSGADIRSRIADALAARSDRVVLGSLVLLGLLQASASVSPVGDDIWHYTEVADALLTHSPYPIITTSPMLQEAGMGGTYPALPFFPLLLALSFSLLGRNLVAVSLPTLLATALFPLAMYAACRAIISSRPVSYTATVLLFLFPVYQIHVLGCPQPDTVFVTLLLLGAALAAKAVTTMRLPYWIATGLVMGMASLTRHEGIAYTAVLYFFLIAIHRSSRRLWLSIAAYLAVLGPFVAFYYTLTGSPWPSTFGRSIMAWQYLEANLTTLSWTSLGWYAQAVGVEKEILVGLLVAGAGCALLGTAALALRNPALAGIPVAGIGNLAAGFFMHPLVVYSPFPVEFLRHISFGIPFTAIALACAAHTGLRCLSRRLGKPCLIRSVMLVTISIVAGWLLYYEAERMARPEWYFGGKTSLLWTGSSYLLADVVQHPVPLPAATDHRSGEEIREAMTSPLGSADLRKVNLSEPYHWASLLVAAVGLLYASTSAPGTRPRRSLPRDRTAPRTACEPRASPS